MAELRTETMTVNMGPQHPSTHGVLRLVLELDGEIIQSAMPTIGYLHTGIEKTAEQKKWQQVIPLVERMDYLAAQSNSLAYAWRGEAARPRDAAARQGHPRAHRGAAAARQPSDLARHARDGNRRGVDAVLRVRERELLLNINELIAGFRFFPSYIRIGGLREDLPRGFHEAVNAFLDRFPAKIDEFEGLLTKNDIFRRRTEGVGVITQDDALAWGLVGPILRAAGSDYDVRQVLPVSRLRDLRLQGADGDRGRRLRALPRAHGGDARERQDLPGRRSRGSRRPAPGPATTRASCRRRRTRSTRRWKR